MTASHASRILAAAGFVLAAVLFPGEIRAQQGADAEVRGPIRLAPTQLEPLAPPAAGEVRPDTVSPSLRDDPTRVDVRALDAIDPDSVGTMSVADGGLPADMWRGTPRELVMRLLPRLSVGGTSHARQQLTRRLLLSTAHAPEGRGGDDAGALLATRVQLLAAMGDVAAVSDLVRATPSRTADPRLLRIEAETHFLANDFTRACAVVAEQVGADADSFWQKGYVFCQALAGEPERAVLSAGLLREMGIEDAPFYALLRALVGDGAKAAVESLVDPAPLHLAMARAAKLPLPADVIATARPDLVRTIAVSPNLEPAVRADAAERAEAVGGLSTDTLRQIYGSIPFSDADLAEPLSRARDEGGAVGRALLYRAALAQTVPAALAEVVGQALDLARGEGRHASVARVFEGVIARIEPSTDLLWFAPEAIRALLIAGNVEAARPWVATLRTGAMFDDEARLALGGIAPLVKIAGGHLDLPWNEGALLAWLRHEEDRTGTRVRAELAYGLIEAFGDPIPGGYWSGQIATGPAEAVVSPSPAVWSALDRAVEGGRLGEVVLLALYGLGSVDGGDVPDSRFLAHAVAALAALGLQSEARALALEAAITGGL